MKKIFNIKYVLFGIIAYFMFVPKYVFAEGVTDIVGVSADDLTNNINAFLFNQTENASCSANVELFPEVNIERKKFGIHNEFDQYLMKCVNLHKDNIVQLLSNVSRTSDFKGIAYNIEMLLEYYWMVGLWKDGVIMCNDILKKLKTINYYEDDVVHDCLTLEIKIVEICSKFFELLNGNKNIEMNEADERFSENLEEKSVCMGLTKLYVRVKLIMKNEFAIEEVGDPYLEWNWGDNIYFDYKDG